MKKKGEGGAEEWSGGGWGQTRESERKDILKINRSNSDTALPLNKYGRGE